MECLSVLPKLAFLSATSVMEVQIAMMDRMKRKKFAVFYILLMKFGPITNVDSF